MHRAEIVDVDRDLKLVERNIPQPPPNGARIRTAFAGVCHSDLHFLDDKPSTSNGKEICNRDVLKDRGE